MPADSADQTDATSLWAEGADAVTCVPPLHDGTLEQVVIGALDVDSTLGVSSVRWDVHVGAHLGEALHGGHLGVGCTSVDGGLDAVRAALVVRIGLGAAHGHGRGGGVGRHSSDGGQGQGEDREGRSIHLGRSDDGDEATWRFGSSSWVFPLDGKNSRCNQVRALVVREEGDDLNERRQRGKWLFKSKQ